jgi:hypothetical protein
MPVLHPLRTDMGLHVEPLSDGTLQGLTTEGTRHIETLHLNRPPMVERRKMRRLLQALLEREAQQIGREKRLDIEARVKKQKIRRRRNP